MTEVVSVRFRSGSKSYYFDPNLLTVKTGSRVIVDTAGGMEIATCSLGTHVVPDDQVVQPLRKVIRLATEDDLRVEELCRKREAEAKVIAREKIAAHGLDMKLVNVECAFEGSKITFFFTSDGRVDFRDLVRDLAGVFRTRIELRQIGVRDETKQLGGIGICGRPYCCRQFLDDFAPVSTKMAKTQSLSLNPAKISGSCGRLMCCLRYEQEAYQDLVKSVPKNGAFVETPDGYGNVAQVNLLRRRVKVKLDSDTDNTLHQYEADDVAAVPGGRPKPGEEIPHVLVPREKPAEEEEPAETEVLGSSRAFLDRSPATCRPAVMEQAEEPAPAAEGGDRPRSRDRGRSRNRSRGSSHGKDMPSIRLGPGSVKDDRKQDKPVAEPAAGVSETKKEVSPAQKAFSGHGRNNHRRHSRPGEKPSGVEPAQGGGGPSSAQGKGEASSRPKNPPRSQPKPAEASPASEEKSARPRTGFHRRYRGHGGHGGNKAGGNAGGAPKSE